MNRGQSLHPRLEFRRGPQPHTHRPRPGEHDPAAALRDRPHQGPRARRCGDDAQAGQGRAARARLPEDDRQRPSAPVRSSGLISLKSRRGRAVGTKSRRAGSTKDAKTHHWRGDSRGLRAQNDGGRRSDGPSKVRNAGNPASRRMAPDARVPAPRRVPTSAGSRTD